MLTITLGSKCATNYSSVVALPNGRIQVMPSGMSAATAPYGSTNVLSIAFNGMHSPFRFAVALNIAWAASAVYESFPFGNRP